MASYLIPYLDPRKNDNEEDPMFSEYTYGDKGARGKKLRTTVQKGDFLFFHTGIRNKRYITAFYEIEEVMDINKARNNNTIMTKFQNPHLVSNDYDEDETIVFGNSIKSLILHYPLEINDSLMKKLKIPFTPSSNQTSFAAISSKFRNWYELKNTQIDILMNDIHQLNKQPYLSRKQLSSDEIKQLSERDIEQFLCDNPKVLDPEFIVLHRQYQFSDGKRLDLALKNINTGQVNIVEIKKDDIGTEALKQLRGYIKKYRSEKGISDVVGIIVCRGILPQFENEIALAISSEQIKIFKYGWIFSITEI